MSVTTPIEIEGFKDKDRPEEQTGRSIKINGQKGLKEEGAALAAHTMAPVQLECPAVDAC